MPTYEYECEKCGRVFEYFQSMKDAPLEADPECGGKVKRLLGTGAGLIFKGSGFYITDYRSEGYKKAAKSDSGSSSSTGSSSNSGGSASSSSSGGGSGGSAGSSAGKT